MIYGGHLDDKIHGGEGDDFLYGEGGEDVIWGEDGKDIINAGYGWDTVFGGAGCDTVTVYDGGDVVWLGACDDEPPTNQDLIVYGTGRDPENWVVVMDFWLEGAKPWNRICPRTSRHQTGGPAASCTVPVPPTFCLGAHDLFSPGTAANTLNGTMPGKVQGPGCKHDGGPLWISIPLEDDPVVGKAAGGATYAHTIWLRLYQRATKAETARAHPEIEHTNRHPATYPYSRYDSHGRDGLATYHPRTHASSHAQAGSIVEDDLIECLAIALCTTTGA